MNTIGLDIGGANLKAATSDGRTATRAFPIWREPQQLANELQNLIDPLDEAHQFAVTMTAELADCFKTKAEGVRFILGKVEEVARDRPVHVWQTGAEFVSPAIACEIPLLVAAANWHALATWLGRMVPRGPAILVDIGTSTTDVIPLINGRPVASGMTDVERLLAGELLYTGVRRTPLFALAHSVPLRGGHCPLAAELFATTQDVYLLLGELPENESCLDTANGRPFTRTHTVDRICRAVCCDRSELTTDEFTDIAEFLCDVQKQRVRGCIDKVRLRLAAEQNVATEQSAPPQVLISGSGAFLAEQVIADHRTLSQSQHTNLTEIFDRETAEAACAVAVAKLASERT